MISLKKLHVYLFLKNREGEVLQVADFGRIFIFEIFAYFSNFSVHNCRKEQGTAHTY